MHSNYLFYFTYLPNPSLGTSAQQAKLPTTYPIARLASILSILRELHGPRRRRGTTQDDTLHDPVPVGQDSTLSLHLVRPNVVSEQGSGPLARGSAMAYRRGDDIGSYAKLDQSGRKRSSQIMGRESRHRNRAAAI